MTSRIAVFCGSQTGAAPIYPEAAAQLGEEMLFRGYGLVYGGGRIGLMGVIAERLTRGGGEVIGVIPHALSAKEIAFSGASELIVVDTMHERKAIMADRADMFIALPGGYGTCDELFEILTWAQLGIHRKPIGLLNVNQFFDPLLAWLDHMVDEGFLKPKYRDLLVVASTAAELLDRLEDYEPPEPAVKWVSKSER